MFNVNGDLRPIRTRYHKVWDSKVRSLANGLTVFRPAIGNWVSPIGETFVERMIPVRVYTSKEKMEEISDFTAKYYNQEAVMFYEISSNVTIKHYKKEN